MKYDFGEWNVPTKWEDVTLGQVIAIDKERALEKPSLASIIAILCGKSVDEVEQLPVAFVENIISKMSFIQEKPQVSASCSCVIDGERYSVNAKEKLKFGEFVAVETAMKSDSGDVALFLAILCRKDGEAYTSEFENEMLEQRKQMFLDAPCMVVLPVVSFFLQVWTLQNGLSRNYSTVKDEVLNLIHRCSESLAKGGHGSRLCTNSRIRKLRRLEKYIRRTY